MQGSADAGSLVHRAGAAIHPEARRQQLAKEGEEAAEGNAPIMSHAAPLLSDAAEESLVRGV